MTTQDSLRISISAGETILGPAQSIIDDYNFINVDLLLPPQFINS